MTAATLARRLVLAAAAAVAAHAALADSWAPPTTEVTPSARHLSRVTVVPRSIRSPLGFFEDKTEGKEPAGQRRGDPQKSPLARVERKDTAGKWQLLWQKPLVNDVGPTSVLLADDASFLVTFDNWHSAGYGNDVVVIYDRRGTLVRKLSLDQILPPAYVNQLPRSVSSRWWGGKHHLVDGDRLVELQVVEPGSDMGGAARYVAVRIRLADGVVLPPAGATWDRALARAVALEAKRQAAWDKVRAERIQPLSAPSGSDTHAWRHYAFELRERIAREDEGMGIAVLAAPTAERGYQDADTIAGAIEDYDADEKYAMTSWVFASPSSDRLAQVLAKPLRARKPGSLRGMHFVFVGTPADGRIVNDAARGSGAEVQLVDWTTPFPSGKPLPATPPPWWFDQSDRF